MRTVLIIDDHAGFRGVVRTLLEADGFDVVGEAGDGASGLEAARSLHPDLVLLDIQLPDITGFDVARELAGDPAPPPVVLISSRASSDYGSQVDGAGVVGFISKDELSADRLHDLVGAPS